MRILFIGGTMEPGCDGVGDYICRLAGALLQQGHQVSAIALADWYVKEPVVEMQLAEDCPLKVLRIPFYAKRNNKLKAVRKFIENFIPEWVSLQFVPTSFDGKGLPFHLVKFLRNIGNVKLHFMFHELWVGMGTASPFKEILIGKLQRQIIKSLVRQLTPNLIHTNTSLYKLQLEKLGATVSLLPLFSNIPRRGKMLKDPLSENSNLCFVVFGSIHPGAPIEQFAKEAALFGKRIKREVSLTMVGRCGAEQDMWSEVWQSQGLKVNLLGEKSIDEVSEVLLGASVGISTTPVILAQKSGSVAAMVHHGLPVLSVSKPWKARGVRESCAPVGLIEFTTGAIERCLTSHPRFQHKDVSEVAKYLSDSFKGI